MAGGARDLGIELRFRADSREARAAIQSLSGLLGEMPADAKKATGGMRDAFRGVRNDLNQAFTFSAGAMIADGLQSGIRAVAEFGADSIKTFLEVEEVMTGVAKTTGLPKAEIEKLNTSLRDTAAAIGPITTAQLGAVAEVAGRLGVASDKIQAGNFQAAAAEIEKFSLQIGQAAVALPEFTGGAEEIAEATTKVLNLYSLGTESVDQVLSVANSLSNTMATDAKQIFSFLEGFTSANSLGILNEQAQAIGATFISLGQDPHDAATRFQTALSTLNGKGMTDAAAVVAKSESALQRLSKISGVAIETLNNEKAVADALVTAMNTDIVGAGIAVATAIGELETNTQRLDAADEIFGKVGAKAMMTLSENAAKYDNAMRTAQQSTADAAQGIASYRQEFEIAVSTQGAKFAALDSQITAVKEVIGKDLVNALGDAAATDITPLVEDFRGWLETSQEAENLFKVVIPGAISLTAQAITGLANVGIAAYNGIVTVSNALGEGFVAIEPTLRNVSSSVSGAAQKTAGLLNGLTADAQNAVQGIRNALQGSPFDPLVNAAAIAAQGVIGHFGGVLQFEAEMIGKIAEGDFAGAFQTALSGIQDVLHGDLTTILTTFEALKPAFPGVQEGFQNAIQSLQKGDYSELFTGLTSGAEKAIDDITASFAGSPFEPFVNAAGAAAQGVIDHYGTIAATSASVIAEIADGDIAGAYEVAFTGTTELIADKLGAAAALFEGFAPEFSGLLESASANFSRLGATIAGHFAEMENSPQGFKDAVVASLKDISQVTSDSIEEMGGSVKETFLYLIENPTVLTDAYHLAWEQIKGATSIAWTGIKTATEIGWDTVKMTFADVADIFSPFADTAHKTIAGVKEIFDVLWEGLKDGPKELLLSFDDLRNGVVLKLAGMLDAIPGPVKKLFGIEGELAPILDASAAMSTMDEMFAANSELFAANDALRGQLRDIRGDLAAAIESGVAPSEELIGQMNALREAVHGVGVEAYGNSTFPDMDAAIQSTVKESETLTAEMETMRAEVADLGAEYEAVSEQVDAKQRTVKELGIEIRKVSLAEKNASKEEKAGLKATLVELRNKKDALQIEVDSLKLVESSAKEAYDGQVKALREVEKEEKAVAKTREGLIKDLEKAERERQQETKRAIDEEARLYSGLDEKTQAYLFSQQDVVAALRDAGFEVTEYTAAAIEQAQAEYQAEQATKAASDALEKMADSAAGAGGGLRGLVDSFGAIDEKLGSLSGGIGKLGGLLNIDTGGITGILSQVQEYAQIPGIIEGVMGSVGGLAESLGGLGGIGSTLSGILGGGGGLSGVLGGLGGAASGALSTVTGALGGAGGAISGLVGGLGGLAAAAGPVALAGGVIYGAWKGIGALFKEHKSEGRKATEAWQEYVGATVSGGDQIASAIGSARSAMDFGDQMGAFTDQTQRLWDLFANTNLAGGIAGTNTALEKMEAAMGAAGVQAEKIPQVMVQTMQSFQDMGLSGSEMAQKLSEMLGLTESEASALAAAMGSVSGSLSDVQQQMSGTGEEGVMTTASLDNAKSATRSLKTEVDSLGAGLDDVTGKLSGTSTTGGDTTAMLDGANLSAADLTNKIQGLSSELGMVSGQLTNTGGETAITSGLFGQAGKSAETLKSDTESLSSGLSALQRFLAGSATNAGQLTREMLNAADAAARLDDELVGHSVVPSLGKLFDVSKKSSGALEQETGVLLGMASATRDLDKAVKDANKAGGPSPELMLTAGGGTLPGSAVSTAVAAGNTIGQVVVQTTLTGNYLAPDLDIDALTTKISYGLEENIRAILRKG